LVDFVKDNPEYSLSLTGFADNTGNLAYNLELIQTRINSVLGFLLNQFGLEENQLQTEIGGQVLRSPNRSANDNDRKVEVRVVLKD
jgi:outer membrane protein OmpA-like peptidoglycan-associated protein